MVSLSIIETKKKNYSVNISILGKSKTIDFSLSHRKSEIAFLTTKRILWKKPVIKMPTL